MKSDYGQVSWFERKFEAEGYQQVGAYYGHAVNGYQIFRHQYLINLLKQEIDPKQYLDILDVGCGLGDFLYKVGQNFNTNRLIGADFVGPVIAKAKELYPDIEFEQDRLPQLKMVEGKFDLIILNEVLYYLNESDRHLAMQRLNQLLRPNGFVLISSVLAPNAFPSVEALTELVSPYMPIRNQWLQNSRLYSYFVKVLILSRKVSTAKPSNYWPKPYRTLYNLFHKPLIGAVLRALNKFIVLASGPILRSQRLPAFFTSLGNTIGVPWLASNIVMLLQKEGEL